MHIFETLKDVKYLNIYDMVMYIYMIMIKFAHCTKKVTLVLNNKFHKYANFGDNYANHICLLNTTLFDSIEDGRC